MRVRSPVVSIAVLFGHVLNGIINTQYQYGNCCRVWPQRNICPSKTIFQNVMQLTM